MIKKIILLVLSFSFSVTSVVYGAVTKADPVSSGTGTGTSVKIADTSALSNVMAQIPSFDDYTGEKTIRELYPDFKSFTMVETGYGENVKENPYRRETVKDGEIEYVDLIQRNIETTNHSLSISFTEDAVYYHSVGSKIETNIYYEYEMQEGNDNGYAYNYYSFSTEDDFVDAERTIINFDAEIYHSKEATLIKYNKWETLKEVSDTIRYSTPIFKAAEEEATTEDDADDTMEKQMQEKAQKMREDNYGTWIKLETYTEEDLANKYGDVMNSDTPPSEDAYDVVINYMIDKACSEISKAEKESLITANTSNCKYLGKLASFITTDNENVSFDKNGNEYKLINSKRVQTGTNPETNEPIYEDKAVGKEAYISTIFESDFNESEKYWTNVYFAYAVGSDVAVVDQDTSWSTQDGSDNRHLNTGFKMDTTTNFFALDNTVASIEKGAKVKTITEAYGNGLRDMFKTYLEGSNEGDN